MNTLKINIANVYFTFDMSVISCKFLYLEKRQDKGITIVYLTVKTFWPDKLMSVNQLPICFILWVNIIHTPEQD